jgi:hypothetical protein
MTHTYANKSFPVHKLNQISRNIPLPLLQLNQNTYKYIKPNQYYTEVSVLYIKLNKEEPSNRVMN